MLREHCLSTLGQELVEALTMSEDAGEINEWLEQTREFRRLQEESDDFPQSNFFDVRESVSRIRLEGTHLEEDELFDLRRSLETIHLIIRYLNPTEGDVPYPALQRLTEGVRIFPNIVGNINRILDKFGKIKDSASSELANIRPRRKAAFRAPYIIYCGRHRVRERWKKTSRPPSATDDL